MGLAILVLIWLITFFSTYFFAAKTWWLPHGVSTSAPWIDHQFALTFVVMGVVFVAAQVSLGYLVWKYRARPSSGPVRYSHGNTTLEILWTALTAILFIGLNLMGSSVWATERFEPAKAGSVPVEVTGMQFAWYFRFKQDAVPGLAIHMHFTPTEIGDYEIACAELCGLGHYKMHGMVKVISQADFDKWLAQREADKQ